MRYTLDEFLELSQSEQAEYWHQLEFFVDEGHETCCDVAIEANTDTSIGSGRIPQCVSCDCAARDL